MSWKEISTRYQYQTNQTDTSQIVKIRSQNIQLQAQLQQKQMTIRQLSNKINEYERNLVFIQKIVSDLLNKAEYKIQKRNQNNLQQKMTILQNKFEQNLKALQDYGTQQKFGNKDKIVNEQKILKLEQQIVQLIEENSYLKSQLQNAVQFQQNQKKNLRFQSNKIQQQFNQTLQINQRLKKDIQILKNNNSHQLAAQNIKRQCRELLMDISVNQDDHLRGYLNQYHKSQRNTNSYARRDKYNFIFDR